MAQVEKWFSQTFLICLMTPPNSPYLCWSMKELFLLQNVPRSIKMSFQLFSIYLFTRLDISSLLHAYRVSLKTVATFIFEFLGFLGVENIHLGHFSSALFVWISKKFAKLSSSQLQQQLHLRAEIALLSLLPVRPSYIVHSPSGKVSRCSWKVY